jgi:hypothetical protein
MDFDQTWYILSPYESLEPYWFSRSKVKVTGSNFYRMTSLCLVKIHWRMLILECSQGCYTVKKLPSDLDLWPWKSIGFQILLRTTYVPCLVKIHWRMLILFSLRLIIPSPTKLQGDIVTLPSVRHNPCEHSRINILQWILTKLGTYLVLKRIWNPIDFLGQRSRSQGQIFTA